MIRDKDNPLMSPDPDTFRWKEIDNQRFGLGACLFVIGICFLMLWS